MWICIYLSTHIHTRRLYCVECPQLKKVVSGRWEADIYNSSHCMSGTRRAISNIKRREPDIQYVTLNVRKFLCFLPTKDLAPFSCTYPTKNPSFKLINNVYSRWHMLSTAKSANVGFRPAVQLFATPETLLMQKIPFINSCQQCAHKYYGLVKLGFRVRFRVRVSLV